MRRVVNIGQHLLDEAAQKGHIHIELERHAFKDLLAPYRNLRGHFQQPWEVLRTDLRCSPVRFGSRKSQVLIEGEVCFEVGKILRFLFGEEFRVEAMHHRSPSALRALACPMHDTDRVAGAGVSAALLTGRFGHGATLRHHEVSSREGVL